MNVRGGATHRVSAKAFTIAVDVMLAKIHSVIGYNGSGATAYLQLWGDAGLTDLIAVVQVPDGGTGSIEFGLSGCPLSPNAFNISWSSTALTFTLTGSNTFQVAYTYS